MTKKFFKKKKKNKKKERKLSPYKRGLKIGCINTRGLVSCPTKRIDLNNWMVLHDLDAVCIQEWYVPHKKDVKNSNNNNNNNENDNEEKQFNLAPLKITLDMSSMTDFEKVEHDNKTIIVYKSTLDVIRFDHFGKISDNGIDISWLGIITNRKILIIGSMYHSPSYKGEYDRITQQMNRISRELAHYNKQVIFMINGDLNSKHEIWGSTVTEPRGEYLLDWLGENELTFLNNGDWTYKNANGKKDVLDIMSINMAHEIW